MYKVYCNRCGKEVFDPHPWVVLTDFYPSKSLHPEEMKNIHRYTRPLCEECSEKVHVFIMPMKREDISDWDVAQKHWKETQPIREEIYKDAEKYYKGKQNV